MSGPRRSSGSWRDRQERDPWVQKARQEGYRSRAVYKLAELADKAKILKRGMLAVDLGAAPGGWSQYVARRLNEDCEIIALDLLPMDSLPGVTFIQGDFREDEVLQALNTHLAGRRADLVMSDMAPNISGVKAVDQPRAMYLAELALALAADVISPKGAFVCKVFQGEGFDDYVRELRRQFGDVKIRKPKASRPSSTEVYVLARNYRLV
ncbi:MAG: 23S rRNA (uridine(2552)-2'-O)-methyltransferase RlmE [Pseudomonadota bacterium]